MEKWIKGDFNCDIPPEIEGQPMKSKKTPREEDRVLLHSLPVPTIVLSTLSKNTTGLPVVWLAILHVVHAVCGFRTLFPNSMTQKT